MSLFLKMLEKSKIIERLRKDLSENDKKEFDKMVEKTVGEYNQMYLDMEPMLQTYEKQVKEHANKSEGQHRQHDESDNEQ